MLKKSRLQRILEFKKNPCVKRENSLRRQKLNFYLWGNYHFLLWNCIKTGRFWVLLQSIKILSLEKIFIWVSLEFSKNQGKKPVCIPTNRLFMCQDKNENKPEDESFCWFWIRPVMNKPCLSAMILWRMFCLSCTTSNTSKSFGFCFRLGTWAGYKHLHCILTGSLKWL